MLVEDSEISYYCGCPAGSPVTASTELKGLNALTEYQNVLYYVLLHALDANTRDSRVVIIA